MSDHEKLFNFVTGGILLNTIGIFGLIGNVITMIVISRPQMRSSTNYLLTWLARCDSLIILTCILIFGIPPIYQYTQTELLYNYQYKICPYVTLVAYPVAQIVRTASMYLTLTVTLERHVAVSRPLHARSYCTYGKARLYVVCIIVFSVLFNLSKFWEVEILKGYDEETNSSLYVAAPTTLRLNSTYQFVYINWLNLVFVYLLPFTCLAIIYASIYIKVFKRL